MQYSHKLDKAQIPYNGSPFVVRSLMDKVIKKHNLFGHGLDVERRHRPRDGFVDVDTIAGDAALAVDARDVVGTGARVTVDAVLAGSAVETP